MAQLLYANQFIVTTLNVGGGIDTSQTTGIIISDVTGIDTSKPGVLLLSYSDPLNTSLCEWVEYASINGSKELVGAIRGSEGYSAKAHDNGVQVAFPVSESHINRLADALSITGVATNGVTGTLDEDDMASNSAVKLATQQSIKAYVDTAVAGSLTLQNITQTNLASNFTASSGTTEQEITGLRYSLPIVSGGTSCKVEIIIKIYLTTVTGNNTVRTRVGTSTSYLTNTEVDNLFVSGAKTLETFTGIIVVTGLDLTAQNYVVISYQNGTNATGASISATNARTTLVTKVYK